MILTVYHLYLVLDNECITVHNNFIKGADSKLYREKEMLFFKVDLKKYYTSLERNYFSFLVHNAADLSEIEILLWKGLKFSNNSKFVLILPRVSCKLCNIFNAKWCSYIDCWKIRNINNCFKMKYRENVY